MASDEKKQSDSRVGLWDRKYARDFAPTLYDDPSTGKIAGGFLHTEGIVTIEDWGCGFGGFEKYIGKYQKYIGIDGSQTRVASQFVDLEKYTSNVDAIHMRHVLEHNLRWREILINALTSFRKRMVLTLFTPFEVETKVIARYPNFNDSGIEMVDIGFARKDLLECFSGLTIFSIENIKTDTQYGIEHMFFLEKPIEVNQS